MRIAERVAALPPGRDVVDRGHGRVRSPDDPRLRKHWLREDMIVAAQRWTETYGEPPRYADWHTSAPRFDPVKFCPPGKGGGRKGPYPSPTPVCREFGSWTNFLKAASL